jgi:hypothetical protein
MVACPEWREEKGEMYVSQGTAVATAVPRVDRLCHVASEASFT